MCWFESHKLQILLWLQNPQGNYDDKTICDKHWNSNIRACKHLFENKNGQNVQAYKILKHEYNLVPIIFNLISSFFMNQRVLQSKQRWLQMLSYQKTAT